MKQPTVQSSIPIVCASLCLLACILWTPKANAMSLVEQVDQASGKSSVTLAVVENPELVAHVLESLLRSVIYSSSVDLQPSQNGAIKRGLDLGISRGFSGSQAGKHLMGLSAASFANGPGKK